MSADLNEVFAEAFVEALAPIRSAVFDLVNAVSELHDRVESLEESRILVNAEAFAALDEATRESPSSAVVYHDAVCGATPPADDLFPGQRWTPCDLQLGHAEGDDPTAHNSGLIV